MADIETVKVAFTDEERLQLGEKLAESHETAAAHDEAAKESAKEYREEGQKLWEVVAGYAQAMRLGFHEIRVETKAVYNNDTHLMDILRVDTGEILRSREPRPDEKLTPLPFEESEEPTP